jgi:hypothetical protein
MRQADLPKLSNPRPHYVRAVETRESAWSAQAGEAARHEQIDTVPTLTRGRQCFRYRGRRPPACRRARSYR